jgi:hypothetical protein
MARNLIYFSFSPLSLADAEAGVLNTRLSARGPAARRCRVASEEHVVIRVP